MGKSKDEYHEEPSYFQAAIDTALLPVRIATSPALLRTYLRTILLLITSSVLFALAVIAYSSFYYSYIPVRGISVPIYLQFDHGKPSPFLSAAQSDQGLFGQTTKWPYGIANVPDLVSRQKYDVVVEMTVPRSRANLNAGNWMVGLELRGPSSVGGGVRGMLGWDEEWNVGDYSQGVGPGASTQKAAGVGLLDKLPVLARSKRPAILTYRSYIIEHAYRFLRLPLYLVGWYVESEHIEIGMMEGVEFDKGAKNVPGSVRVEVRSRVPLEVYTVSVRFSAKLEGIRWIMYRYWLSSAATGIFLFWSVEMGVLLFTWAIFTLLFSHATSPETPERKQIKHESTDSASIKREDAEHTEPETPLSDTSRTFPTLPSQQPLHYTSTSPASPKEERATPALEDIPAREDAEADDEEDDDFVLQEPVPVRTEREGVFTDSGIGTSVESSIDRGLSRRRSGRLRGEER